MILDSLTHDTLTRKHEFNLVIIYTQSQHNVKSWAMSICYSFCTAVCDVMDGIEEPLLQYYGVDENGPIVSSDDGNIVEVPPLNVELSHEREQIIMDQIDPLSEDDNYGITIFMRMVYLLQ